MSAERGPHKLSRALRRHPRRRQLDLSKRQPQETVDLSSFHRGKPFQARSMIRSAYEDDPLLIPSLNRIDQSLEKVERAERKARRRGTTMRWDERKDTFVVANDLFSRKYGGVSLDDISNLPRPITIDGIRSMNLFWVDVAIKKAFRSGQAHLALAIATRLAPRQVTGADSGKILTPRLRRIRSNMSTAFRLYTERLLNFSSEEETDAIVEEFPDVIKTEGLIYTYEQSGLSLSSVQKLALQREHQMAALPNYWIVNMMSRFVVRKLAQQIRFIREFRQLNTPWDYLVHDEQIDKRAERIIAGFYNFASETNDELEQSYSQFNDLMAEWKLFHPRLFKLISTEPQNYDTQNHPIFSKIQVLARTEESTHFVLFFKDSEDYLTIDIDSHGRVFGLPPTLAKSNPHAGTIVGKDVLDTLLPLLAQKHPDIYNAIEQKKRIDANAQEKHRRWDEFTPVSLGQPGEQTITRTKEKPQVELTSKKRRRRSKGPLEEAQLDPLLESAVTVAHPVRLVNYSEDAVRELLGKRVSEKLLRQTMSAIRRFEFGHGDVVNVSSTFGESGMRFLRIKAGAKRVVLEHKGNNVFELVKAGRRTDHFYPHETPSGLTKGPRDT